MTMPHEKDNALKHARIFFSAVLRLDKDTIATYGDTKPDKVHIPKWLRQAACRITRHYPSIDNITNTKPFETLEK